MVENYATGCTTLSFTRSELLHINTTTGRHTYCDERPTFRWKLAILKTVLESWNSGHVINICYFFSPYCKVCANIGNSHFLHHSGCKNLTMTIKLFLPALPT